MIQHALRARMQGVFRIFLIGICCFFVSFASEGQQVQIDSFKQLLQLATSDSLIAKYSNSIGIRYRPLNSDSALYYFDKGEAAAVRIGDEMALANLNFNRAGSLYMLGEYDEALRRYQSALPYMEKYNTRVYFAAISFINQVHIKQGKLDSAVVQTRRALDHFILINDSLLISQTLNNLGVIYSSQGNIAKAIEHFYKSALLKEELGDVQNAATSYFNIGDMHRANGDLTSARYFNIKGMTIIDSLHLKTVKGTALIYLGDLELSERDTLKAKATFTQAYDLSVELHNENDRVSAAHKLAIIYLAAGDYKQAEGYLQDALAITLKIKRNSILSSIYIGLADVEKQKKNPSQAIVYLEKALAQEKEVGNISTLQNIYADLSDMYYDVGDYRKSIEHLRLSESLQDSISGEEKIKAIAELQTRYQVKEKESQLAAKNLQIERNQNRQKNMVLLILGLILFGVLIMLLWRNRSLHKQANQELEINTQKLEKQKLSEINTLKSNFLTNISHEFRTPITMILGPIRQMLDGSLKGDRIKYLGQIEGHAERLLQLVDQLLELARMESGKIPIKLAPRDISKCLREIVYAYDSFAESQVKLLYIEADEPISGLIDREVIEKVLGNLITNGIKYTKDHGEVAVSWTLVDNVLRLVVKDNGRGIAAADQAKVFDRFYQVSPQDKMGSGVGLALTKELVELHGGKISLRSTVGEGSTFTVEIPIGQVSEIDKSANVHEVEHEAENEVKVLKPFSSDYSDKSAKILIVEDNEDVQRYIKEQLEGQYSIITADNGRVGLSKAESVHPDLIITDLMMPDMDGLEMVRAIRSNMDISHIPVIMLTAKANKTDILEGVKAGGEVYMTKPFHPQELLARIETMLRVRSKIKDHFTKDAFFVPKPEELSSPEADFMKSIQEHITDNIENEQFSVVELSQLLFMSRSTLHRKLKSVTGMGPNTFIRNVRLQQAKVLLSSGQNVTHVAYQVGFSNMSYFSKCYREKYGYSPSEELVL